MKNLDSMFGPQIAEHVVTIEVGTNVKLVRIGGGGAIYLKGNIFLAVVLRGFLPSLIVFLLVLLLLSFWL
ncbi:MAG: hypothetical protein LBJ00_06675 [Planctomycetaceae bacterium]|jgi:hypothetical protein|nr:hypothetical protein [Planctomycetaceae bacterium]